MDTELTVSGHSSQMELWMEVQRLHELNRLLKLSSDAQGTEIDRLKKAVNGARERFEAAEGKIYKINQILKV